MPGFLGAAKHGSLGGGGPSPQSLDSGRGDLSPGSSRKSGRGVFCLQGLLLVDTREEELLDGKSEDFSRCSSFPDISEPGDLGQWSSPSTWPLQQQGAACSWGREHHGMGLRLPRRQDISRISI